MPSLAQRVHLELAKCIEFDKEPAKEGFSDEVTSALIQKGKAYERGFDFSAAIDVYLTLDAATTSNHDLLSKACDLPDAADIQSERQGLERSRTALCKTYPSKSARSRRRCDITADAFETISRCCRDSCSFGQLKSCDSICQGSARWHVLQEVVQMYCLGGLFAEAQEACGSDARLLEFVESFHRQELSQSKDVEGLIQHGHIDQVLTNPG